MRRVEERSRAEFGPASWIDFHTFEEPAAEIAEQHSEEVEHYIRSLIAKKGVTKLGDDRLLSMTLVKLPDRSLALELVKESSLNDVVAFGVMLPLISFFPRDEARKVLESVLFRSPRHESLWKYGLRLLVVVGDESTVQTLKEFIKTHKVASPVYEIALARLEEKLENARLHADIDWEEQEMLLWRVMHDRPSHIIPARKRGHTLPDDLRAMGIVWRRNSSSRRRNRQ